MAYLFGGRHGQRRKKVIWGGHGLLQRCNAHIDLRIVCCNDVTVISTSESFAAAM